jgi:hypothetical protein
MHLLDLFVRPKVNSGVATAQLPPRITATRVIARPVAAIPAPTIPISPPTRSGQAPPEPNDLRRLIFLAAASNDSERLAMMFRDNPDGIVDHAVDWMKVPDALRPNPAAVRWYSDGLRAVAQYCADRLNRPDLFSRLEELGLALE